MFLSIAKHDYSEFRSKLSLLRSRLTQKDVEVVYMDKYKAHLIHCACTYIYIEAFVLNLSLSLYIHVPYLTGGKKLYTLIVAL